MEGYYYVGSPIQWNGVDPSRINGSTNLPQKQIHLQWFYIGIPKNQSYTAIFPHTLLTVASQVSLLKLGTTGRQL